MHQITGVFSSGQAASGFQSQALQMPAVSSIVQFYSIVLLARSSLLL